MNPIGVFHDASKVIINYQNLQKMQVLIIVGNFYDCHYSKLKGQLTHLQTCKTVKVFLGNALLNLHNLKS